ncbi:MAG: lipid-A-disaccharide synthase [candidate division FCPU426 bacterium]
MAEPKILVVAGEASGDQHGADLVAALRQRRPGLQVLALGGERLRQAGARVEFDLVSHAVIGITEALRKLGSFLRALRCARDLLRRERPDAVVLIDLPDLNFRIGAMAKALGIPVVYYISPQIWAWRRGRINTLRRLVDRMLVILPFEEAIYREAGIPVAFVGNPLVDQVKLETDPQEERRRLLAGAAGPLVALLPGSRSQEIEFILPAMAEAGRRLTERFPGCRLILPLARTVSEARVAGLLTAARCPAVLVRERPFAARAAADLAIVSSGTATLETALLGTPQLIVYRMQSVSYWLARRFVKLDFFGLANLVAGERVAPEFLQHEYTAEAVFAAAVRLLTDSAAAQAQRRAWDDLRKHLGGPGVAERAAGEILDFLSAKKNPS